MPTFEITANAATAARVVNAIKANWDETANMSGAEAVTFAIKELLRPIVQAHAQRGVSQTDFDDAMTTLETANAGLATATAARRSAENTARDDADVDIDSIS